MTYSLDIINLTIKYLSDKKSKKFISDVLQVSRQTIFLWSKKYKNNIVNTEPITNEQLNNDNHKNNKINKYINIIKEYVNDNIGCSLNDIYSKINKNISISSICTILKKLNITHKKINNNVVCKDINKIIRIKKYGF